jgi:DNA-binding transcriptional LysR family regulator
VFGVMNATHNIHGNDETDSWMKEPLDSRQLRAFAVLARTSSFTQTARELHLTQSGISHSIKALEKDTGCLLLHRVGKKVVLTQAGEQLLHHVERILREMQVARESLEHLGQWGKGRLRISASTTACQYIIPPVLREFKKKFPEYNVTIEASDTPGTVLSVLQGRVDLALALAPGNEPQLQFDELFRDELQFLVSPQHPWAKMASIPRSEIPRQSFIHYNKNSITFRLVENYFRRENITLNTVIEVGSMEATKELVKLGLGVCVMANWVARKELEEKSLVAVPLGRRKLVRTWGMLHLQAKRLSLAEESFIATCKLMTEKLGEARAEAKV